MAEVASSHPSDTTRGRESEHLAGSTPSFTAVNGTASPAPTTGANTRTESESQRDAADTSNHRPLLPHSQQDSRQPPYTNLQEPPNYAPGPSHPERRNEPASTPTPATPANAPPSAPAPAQGFKPPTPAPVPIQPAERPSSRPTQYPEASNEPRPKYPNGHARDHPNHQHDAAPLSPHLQKRKRSFEGESEQRRNEYERPPPIAQPFQANGPNPNEGSRGHDMENGSARERPVYSPRQPYPPPPASYPPPPQDGYGAPMRMRENPDIYPRPERHHPASTQYEQHVDQNIAPAPQRQPYYSDPQEAHLATALQREARGYETMPPKDQIQYGTPDDDEAGHDGYYASYRSSEDQERKRRKRVFSNRTKTGCMTCRRRKKKCDEQHPECNNCLRGGFVCEGYTMRNTWQKPTNTKAPIPLQSKDGYLPPGTPSRAPYPPQPRYSDVTPEYPGPAPQARPQSYDHGDRGKPINVDDEREGVYGRPSPPDSQSKSTYGKAIRPYPSNVPRDSQNSSFGNGPQAFFQKPSSDTQDQGMYPLASVHHTNSVASQYSVAPHPPNHNNTPPNHNSSSASVQAIAQAASTHTANIRPSPQRRGEAFTEREKMLKGLYYFPMTPALTDDRERCIAAIWRFNNATNPSHGASQEERSRLFRQIIQLRPTPEPPGPNGEVPRPNMDLPFGSVGERVVVEAPFHCDYGYNITIGDDVLIGADCRISDTCSVSIGARCIFSPNVKLVCATYPIDPRRRQGSNGPGLGRSIVIEEDCWIGSNVTILAGVRVGKSSTVGAGSLLHQDVPRFTVVAGNPAKVSRGIYDGNADGQ